jgi:hypothetical protein
MTANEEAREATQVMLQVHREGLKGWRDAGSHRSKVDQVLNIAHQHPSQCIWRRQARAPQQPRGGRRGASCDQGSTI